MIAQFDAYCIDLIQEKDAWKICDFMVANEARFKHYFPKTLEQNLTPTLSELFVQKMVKQYGLKEAFLFTLKHGETRELAGIIYIKKIDWNKKQGEFAYCIGYSFEGQNLTSRAIKALSDYAFSTLGLQTLQIISHKDNLGSIKVALKNHFKWQKTLENEFTPVDGQPLNMELYELYRNH